MGSWFPDRKLDLSLWVGSTDSKMLDHQRTSDPRKYTQRELPQKPPPKSKTWHHSTACSTAAVDTSPKQQARQEHKPNHQQTGPPTDTPKHTTSHSPPIRGESSPPTGMQAQGLHKPPDQPHPSGQETRNDPFFLHF